MTGASYEKPEAPPNAGLLWAPTETTTSRLRPCPAGVLQSAVHTFDQWSSVVRMLIQRGRIVPDLNVRVIVKQHCC